MTERRLRRPRDPLQLGKLIVDIATGQVEDREDDGKDPNAAALGRKGGAARAAFPPRPSWLPRDTAPLGLQQSQAVLGAADQHEQALVKTALGGTDRHRRPQECELPLGADDRLIELGLRGPA
jgi:hypothetical protein